MLNLDSILNKKQKLEKELESVQELLRGKEQALEAIVKQRAGVLRQLKELDDTINKASNEHKEVLMLSKRYMRELGEIEKGLDEINQVVLFLSSKPSTLGDDSTEKEVESDKASTVVADALVSLNDGLIFGKIGGKGYQNAPVQARVSAEEEEEEEEPEEEDVETDNENGPSSTSPCHAIRSIRSALPPQTGRSSGTPPKPPEPPKKKQNLGANRPSGIVYGDQTNNGYFKTVDCPLEIQHKLDNFTPTSFSELSAGYTVDAINNSGLNAIRLVDEFTSRFLAKAAKEKHFALPGSDKKLKEYNKCIKEEAYDFYDIRLKCHFYMKNIETNCNLCDLPVEKGMSCATGCFKNPNKKRCECDVHVYHDLCGSYLRNLTKWEATGKSPWDLFNFQCLGCILGGCVSFTK
jgi:hypothetical protein